jgi:hypothetical protein
MRRRPRRIRGMKRDGEIFEKAPARHDAILSGP